MSGIISQTLHVRGCGKLPAHAMDHHCLPALMKNSLPLPQNNCQYQENDLERDTLVRQPCDLKIWPKRAGLATVMALVRWKYGWGRGESHSH